MYCVYITFYSGNKLPPFYIGYSTVEKVNNGYHGSVSSKSYKPTWYNETKRHPHLFKTKIISLYESKEEALSKEEYFQKQLDVIRNPLYVNLHIGHKNFCSPKNTIPWNKDRVNCYSEETLRKFSETHKGKNTWNKGKKHSKETLEKISKALSGKAKNFTQEHRQYLRNQLLSLPKIPHSEETKKKISEGNKGIPKPKSLETRRKISETKLRNYKSGRTVTWNKGKTLVEI